MVRLGNWFNLKYNKLRLHYSMTCIIQINEARKCKICLPVRSSNSQTLSHAFITSLTVSSIHLIPLRL